MNTDGKLLDVGRILSRGLRIGGIIGGSRLVRMNDVSFAGLRAPGSLSLAGESGSGQTAFSRLLLRDLDLRGKVLFDGET